MEKYILIVQVTRAKGGSRHNVYYHEERAIFFIRHFSNCPTLHRTAVAARAACLDPRLQADQLIKLVRYRSSLYIASCDLRG